MFLKKLGEALTETGSRGVEIGVFGRMESRCSFDGRCRAFAVPVACPPRCVAVEIAVAEAGPPHDVSTLLSCARSNIDMRVAVYALVW